MDTDSLVRYHGDMEQHVSFFLKTVREGTDLSGLQFRLKEGVLLPPPIPMH